ncbi:hypothetical protein Jiend_37440 [Micromonospora endophytica]|nr:hypothetical protein Jiend_37440 [Micromonospora endophytica]
MAVVSCALGALVLTLGAATMTILALMFSTKDDDVRKEGLFGSVFFESRTTPEDSLMVSAGLGSWIPLALIWAVTFAFLVLVWRISIQLKERRNALLEAHAGKGAP